MAVLAPTATMTISQQEYQFGSEGTLPVNTDISDDPYTLSDLDMTMPDTLVTPFLIYELPPHNDAEFIVQSFQRGLDEAVKQLPTLAAMIIFDESQKPGRKMKQGVLELNVRQYGPDQHKSYQELAENSFSPSELDRLKLMPSVAYTDSAERPLCITQLNFIPGGIILAFGLNHVPLDMASMDLAISLITKCTKSQMENSPQKVTPIDFNRKPLAASTKLASLARGNLMAQTPDYKVIDTAAVNNQASLKALENSSNVLKGVIYRINGSRAKELKRSCQAVDGISKFVSTYDCISGLLWRSVMRLGAANDPDLSELSSRFLHPVDLRNRPGSEVSKNYFGNAVSVASAGPAPISQLIGPNGLSVAASHIRRSVEGTSQDSIKYVTALGSTLEPSEKIQYRPPGLMKENFLITSWHSARPEVWDFGIGAPKMVRTWLLPMPGCTIIFPDCQPHPDGRIYDCLVILPEAQQDMLSRDVEMNNWFEIL
ncbi:hypothetical protein N7540_008191 [Penicillium herquei]|nr:hypothetical protein N7540_008191 [Penicillium herquei]